MWLLDRAVFEAIQQAIRAGFSPTPDQQADFEARSFGGDGDGPRLLTLAGSSAEIAITGVITKKPDFMAMIFGGGNTTYGDIVTAITAAEQDADVKDITLMIDSPGGQVDGLFDTLAAIQATKKPVKAVAVDVATSAAYAIGVQADEFVASNRATRLGSVGVAMSFRVSDDVIDIASTQAPDKRPDLQTEEGQAVVRELLDSVHQLFAESIATGRGMTVKEVNAEFGQGATLLADEALKRNMIDGIAGGPLKAVKTPAAASGANSKEVPSMDLKELKAQHHDVYAAAVQEGKDGAIAKERDRVNGFLIVGKSSGDMVTALTAIKDGSEMTATLTAQFMVAASNRGAIETRTAEEIEAANALDKAEGTDEERDQAASAKLLAAAFELCGAETPEVANV